MRLCRRGGRSHRGSRPKASAFWRSAKSASATRAPLPLSQLRHRLAASSIVGPGAGAPTAALRISSGARPRRERAPVSGGLDAMREFGGYEMATMMGAMFGGADARQIIIVDGFIATAAACTAVAIEREHPRLPAVRAPFARVGSPALLNGSTPGHFSNLACVLAKERARRSRSAHSYGGGAFERYGRPAGRASG